jgi:V/A-type H+-transporting ATPase subunit I
MFLAVACFLAIKKFNIQGGARKLLKVLIAGGIAATVVGLLTGSIFAMKTEWLPEALKRIILFDPTRDVVLFLYITFVLGLIQILFGFGVKMALTIREAGVAAALMDQGLWIVLLLSLAPLLYKYLFGGAVGDAVISYASVGAKVSALGIILTQGRHTKALLLRPLSGLAKLYSALGYFGDVLSYARLMALGLSGAFLALTVNDLASLVSNIPFGIGYVLAILVIVFGHIFNLALNCLGAFVHSLRLQYLEFFSKFYTGGGTPFRPFAEEREFTIVRSGLAETVLKSDQ